MQEKIKIRNVLRDKTGNPVFVEFWSDEDSRNHIINAEKFKEIFGYTDEDLKDK